MVATAFMLFLTVSAQKSKVRLISEISEFLYLALCLSQFQLGTSPPGNPWENFFERANPGHPGKFFCLIPCPGAKNDGQIPPGWGKIFPNSKKLLGIKLAKSP